MQRIANEMAFPETTFVFPPEVSGTDARVRIFTPSQELPMAGSPAVGTTFALAGTGRLPAGADKTVLGLGIGPTTVGLDWGQNGLRFAWMKQSIPTFGPIVTVYSRMFGPVLGIPEDPATGSASGPLGAYLFKYNAVSAKTASRLVSLQGVRMGRPSRIHIALSSRAGVLEEVQVGGEAVVVGEGTIRA
jgi:predicted PhzF superfamily epimerase YddE/YHI9